MAALIFRRPVNSQSVIPYPSWLEDFREPVVLFALDEQPGDEFFTHVERFSSFETGMTEVRAVDLCREFRFKYIFAPSEYDILRAAELRARFAVSGQSHDSAQAFRDKLYMKSFAQAADILVSPFAALTTPLDLYRFVSMHGYPCVVKPRTGAGSRGLYILRSDKELRQFLQSPFPQNYLVEAFVDAPVFHVDGLMSQEQMLFICASRYINTCLSHKTGRSYGSALLDPLQETSRRLTAAAKKLLNAFPLAACLPFHAEFFVDSKDRIVFCEVASRPGGSGIVDMIERGYGINLYHQWLRRSLSLPINLPSSTIWSPVARVWVPPRRGRLVSLPSSIPFDWVIEYRPNSRPNQYWQPATFCSENIASFTICGCDTSELESRFDILDRWFRNEVKWSES